jgi:hypothetical protein
VTLVTHSSRSATRACVGKVLETGSSASPVTPAPIACYDEDAMATNEENFLLERWRLEAERLTRCPLCAFHPPTQGHREGCPDGARDVSNAAYRQGLCKTCHVRRYRPGGTECETCYREARGQW